MKWKLLRDPILALCVLFSLIWVARYGAMKVFGERFDSSPAVLVLPGLLLLCAFFVPALMVAATVQRGRFVHGLLVGCVGWTLGLVCSIPTFSTMVSLYYIGTPDRPTVGQGEGVFLSLVWIAGLITSPGMGIVAEVAGSFHDRRRAKLVEAAADGPLKTSFE